MRKDSSKTLPPLGSLDTFLAVARLGSFRKAALERRVEPSAVSHTIRSLEEMVGARLFHRTSRSIRLTEAGERLRLAAEPALGDLGAAIAEIGAGQSRPAGRLRVNVPRTVADLLIQPMLGRFLTTYPEIRLEVACNDGLVDIVAEGFDAGIRPGQWLGQGMVAVPVGPPRRFAVVGSPTYFARHGTPVEPQDLQRHLCIERRYPSGNRYAWEFSRNGEVSEIEISGRFVVDESRLMVTAALSGAGLAFLHERFVRAHIANGDLVPVLQDWCPPMSPFYLYYPSRRQVLPALRAFIDMLRLPESDWAVAASS